MVDLPADVVAAALKEEQPQEHSLRAATRELVPLADRVRLTLSSIALIPLATATPEQRSEIVALRREIERVAQDTQTWLDAIDLSFRYAATELGQAKEILLADGVVKVELPRDEVKVDAAALRAELLEASKHGLISLEEIDTIFKTVVETKADGSRLNYFARNRGELGEIIERHRTRTPGNPLGAKLRYVQRA